MTHWTDEDDDDGDWNADREEGDGAGTLSDAENPDPSDTNPDDTGAFVPCPFCRRSLHEDADVCPRCGNFIGGSDDPSRGRPLWVKVVLIVCLAAMVLTCAIKMW